MTAVFESIWERKVAFFATFFVVFSVLYGVLFYLDFLPEPPTPEPISSNPSFGVVATANATETAGIGTMPGNTTTVTPATATVSSALVAAEEELVLSYKPTEIYIPTLEKRIDVLNPDSRQVVELDAALLDGAVRHPDSALLNQTGNLFILGHSSYLPNVLNKNFQAFNGIQHLEWGDTIEVYSGSKNFTFRVEKVYRAKASDLTVPIAGERKQLTLATCNSFGSVDDRYIVEAYQVET